jgi:DNA-binding winged helix-turn-helix (wHTH) protein/tetratricopeptide (TPR) repeat protein
MKTGEIFQFGEFRVDALARTLRRQEEIVTLNRRAFDVLLYFAQNPGRVLTRDELVKNVWLDTFVDENSLAQSISVLRRALAEKPGDNSYIVTLPGRGYQFVASVTVTAPESLGVVATAASSASSGLLFQQQTIRTRAVTQGEEHVSPPISQNRPQVRLIAALFVVAALFAGFYAWKQFHRIPQQLNPLAISSTAATPTARCSIAVLGFRNLSGRPEKGWLSTAMAEMLSTELESGEKLRLVSGEDIARTKLELPLADADSLSRKTLARLRKNLGSDFVVLGSYTTLGEKSDTRIRLDLRLQDTVAGETTADFAVVGSEADLFDLVSQAGSQLREKLGVEAASPLELVSVRASLPSNREAARLYSEGLARLRVFNALEARDLLQQAVAADPKYPLSHSALAEAWSRLGYDKKAQQEARQGYDLSANLSREGRLVVEGRYRDIDHEYEKAIEVYRALFVLFPDNVDYGLKLARVQSRGDKGHDALATVELVRKIGPPASEDPRIELAEAAAWDAVSDFKRQEQPLARAVEKAKSLGARLILAHALENQCWMFIFLEQTQKAVAACRESRDISAAAGDRNGEAVALRNWADALQKTDASESIRLYQQAETIFREVGSEAGMSDVLNNLSVLYSAQGDLATFEKMQREALDKFRLLGNKRNQAVAIANIADARMEQGDLLGAIQLIEEALQLDREIGDTGYAATNGYNLAVVYQLQGDLAGAKQGFEQSIATWQKNGDQDHSALAMWSLGGLLLQEADFSGARKMYEQALTIRTSAGDKLAIAETQLSLADLALEEERSPSEQEAALRQILKLFREQNARDDEIQAWGILARTMFAKGEAAAEPMHHARSLAAKSQDPEIRWRTAITAAGIDNTGPDVAKSSAWIAMRKELAAIIGKSRELGYRGIELDARLALAEIEMKAGERVPGRAHLAAIEADATTKGYKLVARKAAMLQSS